MSEYAYPHSPRIMQFLANSWDKFKTDEEVVRVLMDVYKISYEHAAQHVEMAKEEYGPVGSPLLETINEGFDVTDKDIDRVIKELELENTPKYRKQLKMGLKIEQEHGPDRGKDTNITKDDLIMTAKIAVAHLKEFPDYYTLLVDMEKTGKANKAAKK